MTRNRQSGDILVAVEREKWEEREDIKNNTKKIHKIKKNFKKEDTQNRTY